ncbi:hypothetical protein DASC09_026590 [Saccharomycopsis crataegensis]|uniref:BZIP domain-containing protein n=1 Tax=Saccharomycopsis crataegensis TaxID=43959 RepID=A0AAV5QKV4_9ASCO|nr:hypothetical protein DASC09_026590 [Saccharomycopsis crataegensis]
MSSPANNDNDASNLLDTKNTISEIYSNSSLLEQLVYVETFMPELDHPAYTGPATNHSNMEDDLKSFVDNSFIFTDEEKPKFNGFGQDGYPVSPRALNNNTTNDINSNPQTNNFHSLTNNSDNDSHSNASLQVHIPAGARASLQRAGLTDHQISMLASLIAKENPHLAQNNDNNNDNSQAILSALTSITGPITGSTNPLSSSTNSDTLNNNSAISPRTFLKPSRIEKLSNFRSSAHGISKTSVPSNSVTAGSSVDGSLDSMSSRMSNAETMPLDNDDIKENSFAVTEQDKRRRNTAASARFRIKKKLKEQQLERDLRNLQELASDLESKVKNLKMENQLLRTLVVEKNIRKGEEEVEIMKRRAKKDNIEEN